ncbi:CaiB/BaiF CoA-transferase family protein [Sphingomonas aurantiaca]
MFNRNKRSICLDLKSEVGKAAAIALVEGADILIENFRPGTLVRLGLGPDDFAERHPRLIYCSAKGFLTGPYENRTALDEVTQMMGGLAYMTGPPGRPLRAGASVVDITGGMFGVIGILAALERRHRTGRGGDVKCALFETTAFLVGQHMAQEAVTGKAPRPMPDRISAWAIYDVFETRLPDEQVFVGVVSDGQWVAFCEAFGLDAFLADATLATNNQRVEARERILPTVRDCFRAMSRAEAVALLERLGLPFAPIATPSDLFDDRHLGAGGGLVDLTLEDGTNTRLPGLPIEVDGSRMPRRLGLPTPGEHGAELLREAGLSEDRIAAALA